MNIKTLDPAVQQLVVEKAFELSTSGATEEHIEKCLRNFDTIVDGMLNSLMAAKSNPS